MPSIAETLGSTVMDRSGELVSVSTLTEPGKVVGLYFSSSWCPDRAFTPFLASFFSQFRKTDRGQHFEVVFVSADRDAGAFDEYFSDMPWHAIPYDDLQTRVSSLSKCQLYIVMHREVKCDINRAACGLHCLLNRLNLLNRCQCSAYAPIRGKA